MTPLHLLIDSFQTDSYGDLIKFTETFQIFIERNANLNIQNNFKKSLLHLAIAKPNYTAVSILVNQENIDLDVSFFLTYNIEQIKTKFF